MPSNATKLLLALGLVLCLPAAVSAQPPGGGGPPTGNENVNCNKPNPDSINEALTNPAQKLTIKINGICEEDVFIRRDNVTLQGTSPATDGIEAVGTDDPRGAAVFVRDARNVNIENLLLTGGRASGFRASNSRREINLVNCRLEGNGFNGAVIVGSAVVMTDTFITDNGADHPGRGRGVIVTESAIFVCNNCTIADNGPELGRDLGIFVLRGSSATVRNSSVDAGIAIRSGGVGSFIGVEDSDITAVTGVTAFSLTLRAEDAGGIAVTRGTLDGSMLIQRNSYVRLRGAEQTSNVSFFGNSSVRTSSTLEVGSAGATTTTLVGDLIFSEFGKGIIRDGSAVGDLNCFDGGDVVCQGTVAKNSSNCGLCPFVVP